MSDRIKERISKAVEDGAALANPNQFSVTGWEILKASIIDALMPEIADLFFDGQADLLLQRNKLRDLLQGIRDAIKFEANSDGGWASRIDTAFTQLERLNHEHKHG